MELKKRNKAPEIGNQAEFGGGRSVSNQGTIGTKRNAKDRM